MQTRSNKLLLTLAACIGMIMLASAITETVNSIGEAQARLGQSSQIEEIGCRVYKIRKIATTQEEISNNDWQVLFAMEYYLNGKETKEETRTGMIRSNTPEAVKALVEPICETDWAAAQAKNGTVDTVIIQTTSQDNSILNQVYIASNRTWANILGQAE